ncbi:hypothetical protein [Brachybacterium sp. FME24]|uniref:hypothetical protein n=1 Tax=Brachybacterium sp. FME24 TaxID=2742605 RepID=UPI0018672AE3|nr:hypothetical protein [Brachybacterium sp. FME24]
MSSDRDTGAAPDSTPGTDGPPPLDSGPTLLWPCIVAAAGLVLTILEVGRLVQLAPADGQARPLNGLILAAALACGGFSMTRLLQLMVFAGSRRTRHTAGVGAPRREVPWQLTDVHSLHAVWVIGVGASIALMGLLGLWSLLGGLPSGLEPGWPSLLIGALVALLARLAWQRTTARWTASGDGI